MHWTLTTTAALLAASLVADASPAQTGARLKGQPPFAASEADAPRLPALSDRFVREHGHPANGELLGMILWDNGDTNGAEGVSHADVPRRSIMDDFVVDEHGWTIDGFSTLVLWVDNNDPGTAVDVNLAIYADDGDQPGGWICDLVTVGGTYTAVSTGRIWFGLDEWDISVAVEPFTLRPGRYWIDMQVVGQNGQDSFQMAKDGGLIRDNELWIRYDDVPPVPQRGSAQVYNDPLDVAFELTGDLAPPQSEIVCPTFFNVVFGNLRSGTAQDLCLSDDLRLQIDQRAPVTPLLPNIRVNTLGFAAAAAPIELTFTLEASATAIPPNSRQQLDLWNYRTARWQMVDSRIATSSDSVVQLVFTTTATDYVEPQTGGVQARVSFFDPGNVVFSAWRGRLDVINWDLTYSTPPAPMNDQCEDAKTFGGDRLVLLDLDQATNDGPASSCGAAGPDTWYLWQSQCDGTITIAPSFGRIVVWDGDCQNLGNEVACATAPASLQFAALDGEEYVIQVVDPAGQGGQGVMDVSCEPDPGGPCVNTSGIPNDCCQDATPIGDNLTVPFNNTGANNDGPEPGLGSCMFGQVMSADLWYCYTAPYNGVATVKVCDTDFTARVLVYGPFADCAAACPVSTSSQIACEQDFCVPQRSEGAITEFPMIVGQQYLIRVGGVDEEGSGTVEVTSLQLSNDICDFAPEVVIGGSIEGDLTGATIDLAPECDGQVPTEGVWFWMRGNGNEVTASLCDSETFALSMNVYCGTCDDLECVAAQNWSGSNCGPWAEVTWCTELDHVYWLLVYKDFEEGPFTLEVFDNGPCGDPISCENGLCAVDCTGTPESEPCGSATNEGCTLGNNYELAAPGVNYCGTYWVDNLMRDEDWWQFTLEPGDTRFVVDFAGDIATAVRLVDLGEPFNCQNFEELALWTTPACTQASFGASGLRPGGTYVLVFTTRDDLTTGFPCGQFSRYNFTITSGATAGPPNDDCANAIAVTEGPTPFSNLNATTDGPDEQFMCSFFGYSHIESDIWYTYTPAQNGTVTIDLCNSDYDTKMAVYDGTCADLGLIDPIECNDDACGTNGTRSLVTFGATEGTTYLIRIGGYEGAQGSGTMNISLTP